MEMGYVYAAQTIIFKILLAIIANLIVRWLKSKAETTETSWDDICNRGDWKTAPGHHYSSYDLYCTQVFRHCTPPRTSGSSMTGS